MAWKKKLLCRICRPMRTSIITCLGWQVKTGWYTQKINGEQQTCVYWTQLCFDTNAFLDACFWQMFSRTGFWIAVLLKIFMRPRFLDLTKIGDWRPALPWLQRSSLTTGNNGGQNGITFSSTSWVATIILWEPLLIIVLVTCTVFGSILPFWYKSHLYMNSSCRQGLLTPSLSVGNTRKNQGKIRASKNSMKKERVVPALATTLGIPQGHTESLSSSLAHCPLVFWSIKNVSIIPLFYCP